VVLSHDFWQRRYHGDPEIVGKPITVNGERHTVVGIMPKGFFFPNRETLIWLPLVLAARNRLGPGVIDLQFYPVVARLRDGVALEVAEIEAQALLHHAATTTGEPGIGDPLAGGVIRLSPLRDAMVIGVRPALFAMSAAVLLVLLIACINLANLLLARNSSRLQEMAIRSTLGGGRGRLIRQLLVESMVLSLVGGIAGMFVAVGAYRLMPRILPYEIPRLAEIRLDARVFLFALLLSIVTGLLFGILPAFRSSTKDLVRDLAAGSTSTPPSSAFRGLLVVADVSLALVLLTGAGLLVRNFVRLLSIDLGYEPRGMLAATINLPTIRWGTPERRVSFFDEVLGRVQQRPEVQAAAVVSFPPFTSGFSLTSLSVVGQSAAQTMAIPQLTSPGYPQAMGLRMIEGRWLSEQDHTSESKVVVVNETFARRYLTSVNPVGERLLLGTLQLEIIGVVEDVRLLGLEKDPKAEIYASYRLAKGLPGANPSQMTLVFRTASRPSSLVPFVRTAIFDLDSTLALDDVRPMEARLSASLAQPRFYTLLIGAFAGMALVLATAGVYGVLAYSVSRQTRALGIRRALGARDQDILALVLGRGLVLVSLGLLVGTAASLATARVLAHFLFGVSTKDPISFLAAAVTLGSVALFACYVPARRATRIEPMEAVRQS
jgi:putative ABC transport system permease protein